MEMKPVGAAPDLGAESGERIFRYTHRPDGWQASTAKVVFEWRGASILDADRAYEEQFGEAPAKVPFLACEVIKPEEPTGE